MTGQDVREIVREELEEGSGYSGPGQRIYDDVMAALQQAEEMGGPEGEDYLKLMRAVKADVEQRMRNFKRMRR